METRKIKQKDMFLNMPMWKLLLKMCLPGVIIMSIMGLYNFSDNILSINFAHDNYSKYHVVLANGATQDISKNLVRLIMSSILPQMNLSLALVLMLTVGVTTRVSINLGRGDVERAKNTIKTGTMVGVGIMLITTPIIIFTSKDWIGLQVPKDYPQAAQELVKNEGFKYVAILAGMNTIFFFNNMVSSLLRTEGRMKEATLAMFIPVIFNLLLDYLLMGPGGMGVVGAATATAIADVITLIVLLFFVWKFTDSIITIRNMFGWRFSIISMVGILLVGASPFFRNSAQSITGTIQGKVISDLTLALYPGEHGQMINIFSGVMPIFGLFFPMLFGIIQGSAPVASFNYGAKNIKRVKEAVIWSFIYSLLLGLLIFLFAAVILAEPLMSALGVAEASRPAAKQVVLILMIGAPLFSLAIAGMTLFSSTDRVLFSFISSTARGYILFFPIIFIFKSLAIAHTDNLFIFWWMFPTLSLCAAILITIMMAFTWKKIATHHKTLDERVENIDKKIKMFFKMRKNKKF